MLTHRNLVANMCQTQERLGLDDRSVADRRAALLPHLRADGDHEPRPAPRGEARDDAALRPRAVPRPDRAPPGHARLRRPADRPRARQAPGCRGPRPVLARGDHVGRGAARGRALRAGLRAHRLRRHPGLRPHRDQPGDPLRAAGPRAQPARLDRPAAARTPSAGSSIPRAARTSPTGERGELWIRGPAGDERLPRQRRGHRRRRSTTTAGCTPATSPSATPTATSRSSTG